MSKFTVLKLGDDIDFKLDNNEINKLTTQGYKIVASIEASTVAEARSKFELNKNNTTHKNKGNELSNPVGYLKFTSNLFLFISILGSLILIITGFSLSGSYSTEELSFYYFVSGFAGLLTSLLVHSICRSLIYILKK